MKTLLRWTGIISLIISATHALRAADSSSKPVFLYSRYYNAAGEGRYLPDGTFKDLLENLKADFEVRVNSDPLTPAALNDVKVVLIANPSDKAVGNNPAPPHMTTADRDVLNQFIERGGGLIITENQENHNLETEETNKLLRRFGLQSTNLYTDGKLLVLPKETPIIGGLRWAYFVGNTILVEEGHPAKARALVVNDLSQKLLGGSRDQAGCLLATAEPGGGRVIVITDTGWLNGAAFKGEPNAGYHMKDQDNWEIIHRLTLWAAHSK